MSNKGSSPFEQARQIAFDVMSRRDAGEHITDEEVLARHEELREPLTDHLARLRQLRNARSMAGLQQTEVIAPGHIGDEPRNHQPTDEIANSESDLRMTTLVDAPEADEFRQTMVVERPTQEVSGPEVLPQEATQMYRPTHRPPMAILKLFLDGSRTFSPIPVFTDTYRIGRTEGDLRIEHDPRVSARHAEIQRRRVDNQYKWHLVDVGSTNGTFVRVDHVSLKHDDEIMVGRERYKFIQHDGRTGLLHMIDQGGDVWYLKSNVNWIGRDVEGTIPCMNADPFLDPSHALLRAKSDGRWMIINNDSLNGVWYRVSDVPMSKNCAFQIGEQRLGFRYY